jgi:chemotaxis protein MotA
LLLVRGQGLTFINLPGLVLVVGGTLLASVIGHSPRPVLALLRRVPQLFRAGPEAGFVDRQPLVQIATLYRRGSVRAAEQAVETLQDPYLRAGARLALDPNAGEELSRVMDWRLRRQKEQDAAEVRILRTMSTFAPAFGLLGTLFGLISLLGELGTSGLQQIGMSMGFGLMSTLYGLVTANLLFRPLALKLEDRSRQRLSWMSFLTEALVMLHQRQHPTLIAEYLDSGLDAPEMAAAPAPVQLALSKAA